MPLKLALVSHRRHTLTACLLGVSLIVSGCAGSSLGNSLQQSLEADPQLAENPPFGAGTTASTPATSASTPATADSGPEPGQPGFIGPTRSGQAPDPSGSAPSTGGSLPTPELAQVPEDLRGYVGDLLALDLLTVSPAPSSDSTSKSQASNGTAFQPNKIITRSDYARWLWTINNRFYEDQPDKKIRAGVTSSTPAFKDVPTSHPDFAAIQGLAEAGLIPSALAGNSTAVTFRPEAPLTRKDLILWKVPLDTRQGLPAATVDAVKDAWGFQDAGKIDALGLRALMADYQNGEFANVRRAFGYTTLFQPDKGVTEAEAAAVLWRFGSQTEGISAAQVRAGNAAPTTSAPTTGESPSATPSSPASR